MKLKIRLTKKQIKEIKDAQAVVAKKAKDPNFWKTVPDAVKKVNKMKI